MKCLKCGKPLKTFAVSVLGPEGPLGWGPKCARSVMTRRRRPPKRQMAHAPVERDERQLDWVEVMA